MEATKSKESKEVVKRPDRAELTKQVDGIMAEILALNEKAKKAKAEMERIMNDRGGNRVSDCTVLYPFRTCPRSQPPPPSSSHCHRESWPPRARP